MPRNTPLWTSNLWWYPCSSPCRPCSTKLIYFRGSYHPVLQTHWICGWIRHESSSNCAEKHTSASEHSCTLGEAQARFRVSLGKLGHMTRHSRVVWRTCDASIDQQKTRSNGVHCDQGALGRLNSWKWGRWSTCRLLQAAQCSSVKALMLHSFANNTQRCNYTNDLNFAESSNR